MSPPRMVGQVGAETRQVVADLAGPLVASLHVAVDPLGWIGDSGAQVEVEDLERHARDLGDRALSRKPAELRGDELVLDDLPLGAQREALGRPLLRLVEDAALIPASERRPQGSLPGRVGLLQQQHVRVEGRRSLEGVRVDGAVFRRERVQHVVARDPQGHRRPPRARSLCKDVGRGRGLRGFEDADRARRQRERTSDEGPHASSSLGEPRV
jgi:hypothetical protein